MSRRLTPCWWRSTPRPHVAWKQQIADPTLGYSETMAPTAVDGKILIGTNGGEYGIRGFVQSLRRQQRQFALDFDTIPQNSVGVWATKDATAATCAATSRPRRTNSPRPAIRIKRSAVACGRIRRSMSQPSASISWSAIRRPTSTARNGPATISITDSLVAIDLDTGKLACYFQYIAHDVWDLDAVSPTVLVDVKGKNGNTVPGIFTPARPATSMSTIARIAA